jgi:hypothetical protein
MTSLQQSFSEISRLSEEVSLGGAGKEEDGAGVIGRKQVERLRLMVLAQGVLTSPSSAIPRLVPLSR